MGFTQQEMKARDVTWELYQLGNNDETRRLKVHNGWLVKYTKQGNVGEVVYIPDPKGEWKI